MVLCGLRKKDNIVVPEGCPEHADCKAFGT